MPSASTLLATAATLAAAGVQSAAASEHLGRGDVFTWGHAAYTYGPLHCTEYDCDVVPSCNRAEWSTNISDYNKAAPEDAEINIVYSYGGDIEFWAGKAHPDGCARGTIPVPFQQDVCNVSVYFDPNNQAAAVVYDEVDKVESIVALLDSRMDGWTQITTYNNYDGCKFGNFYPDLSNLTDAGLNQLAKDTASLYCNCPECHRIDGIQVDLEPYNDRYVQPLKAFVGHLGTALRDEDSSNGCRVATHPKGRSVSYFTFAHRMTPSSPGGYFNDALGDNGYYVFSLYDLDPTPQFPYHGGDAGFMYNTVEEFKGKMALEMESIPVAIKRTDGNVKQKFTLALPIGASCHEYEQYVPMKGNGCGGACEPKTNNATMVDYVKGWLDVLTSDATKAKYGDLFCVNKAKDSAFLGLSLWSYSYQMTYPPMKWFNNEFLPGTPPADAMELLASRLASLAC
jgi:hypothetical protein